MSGKLSGLKVLLVEDDFFILLDLQTSLEDAGAKVVTASTVREGLAASEADYHAAVLDIRLPDGEVFPVAHRLTERQTPIIFHSGNTETTQLSDNFPNAIALSKPVHQNLLIDAVQRQSIQTGNHGTLS